MAKKSGAQPGEHQTRSQGNGTSKGKKKAVSRSEKAGLTMSVSKVHAHMLRRKMDKKSGGVTRVSVSAPIWVTAAMEYFAAELLEQAGDKTKKENRKRITVQDVLKALRSDKELDKAMAGYRVLVADKLKGEQINDELLTKDEKAEREMRKATAAESRKAAAAAAQ